MVASGNSCSVDPFAETLAGDVGRNRFGVGPEARDMGESLDSRSLGGPGEGGRAVDMDGAIRLRAAFRLHAGDIDRHLGAFERGRDRGGIAQVRLHRFDLADVADRLQEKGEIRPPHRHAHAPAAAGEGADDVSAEEAGAAEHSRQAASFESGVGHRVVSGKMREEGRIARILYAMPARLYSREKG